MFRLVLDFPLSESEEVSAEAAKRILNIVRAAGETAGCGEMKGGKFRLSRDGDRGSRNFLNKTEEGRVGTSKLDL